MSVETKTVTDEVKSCDHSNNQMLISGKGPILNVFWCTDCGAICMGVVGPENWVLPKTEKAKEVKPV